MTGWFSKGASPHLGHVPTTVVEYPDMAIKKRENRVKDIKHLAPLETVLFGDRLSLIEHCALLQYEDGQPRLPGWLTIATSGAAWRITVKDPDSCSSFSAVGPRVDDALDTACLLLSCDEAPWEADKWLVEAQKRSNKK